MNKEVSNLFDFLDEKFPNAHCELNYNCDYELLIAVMLSAQATDKSVNKVTEKLFEQYPSLEDLSNADVEEIERIIHPVGLSKVKSKNVVNIAKALIEKYGGLVPNSREELMSLPGVGRKCANVVLIECFKIPEIPVDTHVERVSKRLGLASEKDSPLQVEIKLRKIIPEERLIKAHHQLIFFGRYLCKSQRPDCLNCKLVDQCKYYKR